MVNTTRPELPVPDITDSLFAPFWEGTRTGKLVTQYCASCGASHWPPRYYCAHCGSFSMEWKPHGPQGELFAWTVVGKATAKGFGDVPYIVAIVSLRDESRVRIVGNIVGIPPEELRTGMPLLARFTPAGPNGDIHLVQWVRANNS